MALCYKVVVLHHKTAFLIFFLTDSGSGMSNLIKTRRSYTPVSIQRHLIRRFFATYRVMYKYAVIAWYVHPWRFMIVTHSLQLQLYPEIHLLFLFIPTLYGPHPPQPLSGPLHVTWIHSNHVGEAREFLCYSTSNATRDGRVRNVL